MSARRRTSVFVFIATLMFSAVVHGENRWYYGTISHIQTLGPEGGFMVYLDNPDIRSVCAWRRVNVLPADIGPERARLAFSIALAAFAAGKEFGIVVDLPATGSVCRMSPTTSQGAGIRG